MYLPPIQPVVLPYRSVYVFTVRVQMVQKGEREARQAKKEMVEANLREITARALALLTPREERVIRMRSASA